VEFLYHFKAEKFKGDSILPLSRLKRKYPKLYQKEIEKYGKDRIQELEEEIKCLDVKWKDVVNLSTINPVHILSVAQLLGNETDPAEIFKIPISSIKKHRFCLFTDFNDKEKFKPLTVNQYEEEKEIPIETIEHFIYSKEHGTRPLIFEHIPHILVAGEVNISKAEVIKYDPENLFSLAQNYHEAIIRNSSFAITNR